MEIGNKKPKSSFSVPVAKDDSTDQEKDTVQKKPKEARVLMPVRSLTDQEYQDIFEAVAKRVQKEEESKLEIVENIKVESHMEVETDNESHTSCDTPDYDNEINDIDNWDRNDEEFEEKDVTQTTKTKVSEKELMKKVNQQQPFHSPIPVTGHKKVVVKVTCRGQKQKHKSDEKHQEEEKSNIFQKVKKAHLESGHKESPQAKSSSGRRVSLQEIMKEREIEDIGTWVQCGNARCQKWRYLADVADPLTLPNEWTCSMNPDEQYNSCDKPEQDYNEEEHIFTKYTEGSVVWAKMDGYPWWPGMIEIDPDSGTYFEVESSSMYPVHYHVVFLDDKVSRAWTRHSNLLPYSEDPNKQFSHKIGKFKTEIMAAKKNANNALRYSIKERLGRFGFGARFRGKWGYTIEECDESGCYSRPGRSLWFKESTASGTGKKGNSEEKGKRVKRKRSKHTRRDVVNDDLNLDETTIDEIINNTESILSSMEDVIDSLKEEPCHSDDEYEVKCTNSAAREWLENRREARKRRMKPETREETDTEVVRTRTDRVGKLCMQLDPNIFTMEMSNDRNNSCTVTGKDLFENSAVPSSIENNKPQEKKKIKNTKKDGISHVKTVKDEVEDISDGDANQTENSVEQLEPKKKKIKKSRKKSENKSLDKPKREDKKNEKEKKIVKEATQKNSKPTEMEHKKNKAKKMFKNQDVSLEDKAELQTEHLSNIERESEMGEKKNDEDTGDSKSVQKTASKPEMKLHIKKEKENCEGNSKLKLKMSGSKLKSDVGVSKKKSKFIAPVMTNTQEITKKERSEINTGEIKQHASKTAPDSNTIKNDVRSNLENEKTNKSNKNKQCSSLKEKNEGDATAPLKKKKNLKKKSEEIVTEELKSCVRGNGEDGKSEIENEYCEIDKTENNVKDSKVKKQNKLSLKKADSFKTVTKQHKEVIKDKNPASQKFQNPPTDKKKDNSCGRISNNKNKKTVTPKTSKKRYWSQSEDSDDEILKSNTDKVNTPIRTLRSSQSQNSDAEMMDLCDDRDKQNAITPVKSRNLRSSQSQNSDAEMLDLYDDRDKQNAITPVKSRNLRSSQSQNSDAEMLDLCDDRDKQKAITPVKSRNLRSSQSQNSDAEMLDLCDDRDKQKAITPVRSRTLRSQSLDSDDEILNKSYHKDNKKTNTPVRSRTLRSQSQDSGEEILDVNENKSKKKLNTPVRSRTLRSSQNEDSDEEILDIHVSKNKKKINMPVRSKKLHNYQNEEILDVRDNKNKKKIITPVRSRKLRTCNSQNEDSDEEILDISQNKNKKKVHTPVRSRKLRTCNSRNEDSDEEILDISQNKNKKKVHTPVRSQTLRRSQNEESDEEILDIHNNKNKKKINTPVRSRKLRTCNSQNEESDEEILDISQNKNKKKMNTPVRSRKLRICNSQNEDSDEEILDIRDNKNKKKINTPVRSRTLCSSQNEDSDEEILDISQNKNKKKINKPVRSRTLRSSQNEDSDEEVLDISENKNKKVHTPVRSRTLRRSQNCDDQQCPNSDSLDLELDVEFSQKSVENKRQPVITEDSDPFELGEE